MKKIFIYTAQISETLTEGEYQMGETDQCEYGEEWSGDVRGYIENSLDGDLDIHGEAALGNVRQNFGGLDPIPGSIYVVCCDGEPESVYWASDVRASWAS